MGGVLEIVVVSFSCVPQANVSGGSKFSVLLCSRNINDDVFSNPC